MGPTRYTLKKAFLAPHTAYRRRKDADVGELGVAMLESQYYRPTMYRFLRACDRNPSLLVDARLDADSVVVDAGAYDGEWTEQIVTRYGATVHAFEPAPPAVEALTARVADMAGVVCHPYALGASDATVSIALDGPGSSVHADSGLFGSADVRVRDVVDVLDELGVDELDLLKVNIEGSEYDLLDRLVETGWLPRIRQVSVQFHEWHPDAYRRRRRIRRALRRTHEQAWNYPWVWEFWTLRGGTSDRDGW